MEQNILQNVRALATIMHETGLTSLEVEENGRRIHLQRGVAGAMTEAPAPAPQAMPAMTETPAGKEDLGVNFSDTNTVTSPLVGVFYSAPAPDKDDYVKIGDKVKKGDVLCIVEAMKLMNEIASENDGEIVDICASNGDVVEFGQTLFRIV